MGKSKLLVVAVVVVQGPIGTGTQKTINKKRATHNKMPHDGAKTSYRCPDASFLAVLPDLSDENR